MKPEGLPATLRAVGALSSLDPATLRLLLSRAAEGDQTVRARTTEILRRVRETGDDALREMAVEFDGIALDELEVQPALWAAALDRTDRRLRIAMERSLANLTTVHRAFLPASVQVSPEPGIVVGRRPDPLARVGVYAPGGRAAYPSSLLMGAAPARVAGVGEIIVCSPPGGSGRPSDVVLASAHLAGVDRVFALGGAGAIAAMAFGTQSVPRVDRIVGPGNAYVAEAKLQVVSAVAIDSPAGPSELLVVADDTADPDVIAREMVAQAEHDPEAAVIAVISGEEASNLAGAVGQRIDALTALTPRQTVVAASLARRGAVLTTATLAEAIAFANEWAAEHLLLLVATEKQETSLAALRNAGAVFVGPYSSVAYGDYMSGANHVLPTAGAARSYSGLSTQDFVRWTSWQEVSLSAARALADDVGVFADAEGLPAHAATARAWGDSSAGTHDRSSIDNNEGLRGRHD